MTYIGAGEEESRNNTIRRGIIYRKKLQKRAKNTINRGKL